MLRICALFVLLSCGVAIAGPQGAIRVIDADTFDVGGTRVRLFGIDAPEVKQPCQTSDGKTVLCGQWAAREVRRLYQGKSADCTKRDMDRYGRIVAVCRVLGRDMGADLVARGLAFAFRRYSMDYDLIEKGAAVKGVGLWAFEVQAPAAFRAEKTPTIAPVPKGQACVLKGNISAKGVKIFHAPGQKDYDTTQTNTRKGERWFCSRAEAIAAGWRAAAR